MGDLHLGNLRAILSMCSENPGDRTSFEGLGFRPLNLRKSVRLHHNTGQLPTPLGGGRSSSGLRERWTLPALQTARQTGSAVSLSQGSRKEVRIVQPTKLYFHVSLCCSHIGLS